MQSPPYLKPGDSVAIIATARKIVKKEVAYAIDLFESWGLKVVLGKNLFKSDRQFAGTDNIRLHDIQEMLDDDRIKAIICARGGYGTVRIIDQINFTRFINRPKWIVGYSDITVLHAHLFSNYRIPSIHGSMPINFPKNSKPSVESIKRLLFGEKVDYKIKSNRLNRAGHAQGEIVGGNLSILYNLSGTPSDLQTKNKILFIEDLDEYLYHIDRMMMQLKRSGKLKNIRGLIIGGMTKMRDNETPFGKSAEEIIRDAVKELDYPVCFDFPAGHMDDNRAFYIGKTASLKVDNIVSQLEYI